MKKIVKTIVITVLEVVHIFTGIAVYYVLGLNAI